MAAKSLEAKVIEARARVAALKGDERADMPSGSERTAYNKELRREALKLKKLEAAFLSPDYAPAIVRARSHPRDIQPVRVRQPSLGIITGGKKGYRNDTSSATAQHHRRSLRTKKAKRKLHDEQSCSKKYHGPMEWHACRGCGQKTRRKATWFQYVSNRKEPNPGHCQCGASNWMSVEESREVETVHAE